MRFSSPTRRAAGLLAVTTIGLSTAVLSVAGVASAAPVTTVTTSTFSSDEDADVDQPGFFLSTEGDCTITWDLVGAAGGAGYISEGGPLGAPGGHYVATTTSTDSAAFLLRAGTRGEDGDPDSGPGAGGYNGAQDDWPSDGTDGYAVDDVLGGGGGAASVVVTYDGDRYLGAHGGNGGFAQGDAGIGGLGDENEDHAGGTGESEPASGSGDGVISGSMTCSVTEDPDAGNSPVDDDDDYESVTGAPRANWVSGVDNGLQFQLYVSTLDSENPVTGVEYTLDGGTTWKPVATENMGDYQYSGTITGLETATRYSVAFRFTTVSGHTEASETLTGRTAVPGPRDVKAVAGPGSIKVTWAPPASTDEVGGYVVIASPEGAQSDAGSISCQPAAALGTACALAAVPGTTYSLSVHSLDATGDKLGSSDWITVGPVLASTVSASLPKADGTLTSDDADGKVVAGEKITISGKDFLPGSSVDLVVYSTPVKLGTATVLADGTFSATVVLPKDLVNGTHHLVASGVDVNGNPRTLVVEVTVSGGSAALAYTGFSALPVAGAGVLALLAGGGLLVVSRRRQAA